MEEPTCLLVPRSDAEELALAALQDVSTALHGEEYVVVGGMMVWLLVARYPVRNLVPRSTRDADIGIPVIVAEQHIVHERLTNLGYVAEKGNLYKAAGREVDLLVPSAEFPGHHGTVEIAGRGFDAAPGLKLALLDSPITVQIAVAREQNADSPFTVRVPSLQAAVVMKLTLRAKRREQRDLADLLTLLTIRHQLDTEFTGAWTLDHPQRGERGDAQHAAQGILKLAPRDFPDIGELGVLLRRYVAHPQ